jgi:hypothetical protein
MENFKGERGLEPKSLGIPAVYREEAEPEHSLVVVVRIIKFKSIL